MNSDKLGENLKSIADQAAIILNRYITVHDALFRTSIFNVIAMPGIFKRIDFGGSAQELWNLWDELQALSTAASEFDLNKTLSASEKNFLSVLNEYLHALETAITQLWHISWKLHGKAQGTQRYSWFEFRRDQKTYGFAVDIYRSIGERLNLAHRGLRE